MTDIADNMTTVVVENLMAFTDYECFATARTTAGEGVASNTDTATTEEDGRHCICILHVEPIIRVNVGTPCGIRIIC